MKAHALQGRDKPKDVYDLCYCLDQPDGMALVAEDWRSRVDDRLVREAIEILREKFQTVGHYGPTQLAAFHDSTDETERAMYARRAFELVQKLLSLLQLPVFGCWSSRGARTFVETFWRRAGRLKARSMDRTT